jgi:uncharacterized membrane protein
VIKVNKKVKGSIIVMLAIFTLSLILMIPGALAAQTSSSDETTATTEAIEPELTFDVQFPKLNAKAGNNYTFKFDVTYVGEEEATFDIATEAPEGWYVAVSSSYDDTEIIAIKMQPGKKESLKLVASPSVLTEQQKPGDYEIKVKFNNEDLKLQGETTFTAKITSVFTLDFSPKYGVLNTNATAGKSNPFVFVLSNTGSDTIEDITFKADAPQKWIVKFNPEKLDKLAAGETKDIEVTITPPDKTIAGDYMLNFAVNSKDASDNADIRVTVETPSIWGWIGIAIIVIVVVGVAVIFARLGRR